MSRVVGQIANLRPIGNRPPRFRSNSQADYQSAAGYQLETNMTPRSKTYYTPMAVEGGHGLGRVNVR